MEGIWDGIKASPQGLSEVQTVSGNVAWGCNDPKETIDVAIVLELY